MKITITWNEDQTESTLTLYSAREEVIEKQVVADDKEIEAFLADRNLRVDGSWEAIDKEDFYNRKQVFDTVVEVSPLYKLTGLTTKEMRLLSEAAAYFTKHPNVDAETDRTGMWLWANVSRQLQAQQEEHIERGWL